MFRIGQKLVCIRSGRINPTIVNEIYTCDGACGYPAFEDFIFLRELNVPIIAHPIYGGMREAYDPDSFRPVDETFGTEVAEKIESEFINQPEPALV